MSDEIVYASCGGCSLPYHECCGKTVVGRVNFGPTRPADSGVPEAVEAFYQASKDKERIQQLEQYLEVLRDALSRCRGQWIHSVNADRCLEALAMTEQGGQKDAE